MTNPQHFTVASWQSWTTPPGSSPAQATSPTQSAHRTRSTSDRFRGRLKNVRDVTQVPVVLLFLTLAGHAHLAVLGPTRLCQGCSPIHPGVFRDGLPSAPIALLRQGQRRRSLTSTRNSSASWRTSTVLPIAPKPRVLRLFGNRWGAARAYQPLGVPAILSGRVNRRSGWGWPSRRGRCRCRHRRRRRPTRGLGRRSRGRRCSPPGNCRSRPQWWSVPCRPGLPRT